MADINLSSSTFSSSSSLLQMSSRRNSGSGLIISHIGNINFNGTESEDVTEFVREVHRIAIDHGRRKDDVWMVDYAESCLGGNAIRWLSGQDEAVTASWKGLRQALLERFRPPDGKHIPQAAPAAAISNAAPIFGGYLASMGAAIERLQTVTAQLETASALTAVKLQGAYRR